jgi:hypothetical protein
LQKLCETGLYKKKLRLLSTGGVMIRDKSGKSEKSMVVTENELKVATNLLYHIYSEKKTSHIE